MPGTLKVKNGGAWEVIGIGSALSSAGPSGNGNVAIFDGTSGLILKDSTLNIGNVAVRNQNNYFTQDQFISKLNPCLYLGDTSQPANQTLFRLINYQQAFYISSTDDAGAPQSHILTLYRGGDVMVGQTLILNAGRIKFPSAQNQSTDATTLDDYREFNWTPYIGGSGGQSGQVYSVQHGRGIKIGRFIFVNGYVVLSNKGTITGNVLIGGLTAYPAVSETFNYFPGSLWFHDLATAWSYIHTRLDYAQSIIYPMGVKTQAGTSNQQLTGADLTNSTQFLFSFGYVSNY